MDRIAAHQDHLIDVATIVNCINSHFDVMATLHYCIDSHLQRNDHLVDILSAQLDSHAQQVNSVLDPLG
jgi:hypothetical protein